LSFIAVSHPFACIFFALVAVPLVRNRAVAAALRERFSPFC